MSNNDNELKYGFKPTLKPEETKILILGTFPGEESREMLEKERKINPEFNHFYYASKNNCFWELIYRICIPNVKQEELQIPKEYSERINFLSENGVCLWDLIHQCYREGSSKDEDIKEAELNDLSEYINKGVPIIINGRKRPILRKIKFKDNNEKNKIKSIPDDLFMLSTSGSNRINIEDKIQKWKNKINELTHGGI